MIDKMCQCCSGHEKTNTHDLTPSSHTAHSPGRAPELDTMDFLSKGPNAFVDEQSVELLRKTELVARGGGASVKDWVLPVRRRWWSPIFRQCNHVSCLMV